MSVVEKVAFALWKEAAANKRTFDSVPADPYWTGMAKAAIEAMREPSRKMLFAGSESLTRGKSTTRGNDEAHNCFRAMITKALED